MQKVARPLDPVRRAVLAAGTAVLVASLCGGVRAEDERAPGRPAGAARTVDWKTLGRQFDPDWVLPRLDPSPKEPADLRTILPELVERRFPARTGEKDATIGLGDVLHEIDRLGGGARGVDAYLRGLPKRYPEFEKAWRPYLRDLVRDSGLRAKSWTPKEPRADDGFVFGKTLDRQLAGRAPWTTKTGTDDVQQAATLIRADLDTLKRVENDYTLYPGNRGASYDYIHAIPDSYLAAKDPDGRPASSLKIAFKCPLPFPFSSYVCDLRILNRLDDDGHLVTDIYSPSSDFHWMAGQDVFVPVRRSDGTFQALLVIRLFGFDLSGVPDGRGAREQALRSSLGNLKLRAEAAYAQSKKPGPLEDHLPGFPVRGYKPADRSAK